MSIRHGEVVSEPGGIVEAEIEKCISCRIPNSHVLGTESGNTFTYHAAASGDRMLPYCPSCEAEHEKMVLIQNNRRAALAHSIDPMRKFLNQFERVSLPREEESVLLPSKAPITRGKRSGLRCMTLKTFIDLYQKDLTSYYGSDFEDVTFCGSFSDTAIICLVEEGPIRYTQQKRSPRRLGKKRRERIKHRYSFINPFNRIHGYAIVENGNTNLTPEGKLFLSLSLICSSPFSDKKGVGSDLMDILKDKAKESGYTDIILEVANEHAQEAVPEEESDEEESEEEESDSEDEDEDEKWYPSEETLETIAHEMWRKTMRKDIDGDPYYNIDEEYISERMYYYLWNWTKQTRHCVPKGIQDKEEPTEEEYGGFWYRKGLMSSCGLIQFYEKHGFREDRRVHLDWQCYGDIPFPTMIKNL
jgi:ribosomal protein S18 acetylase RimI-like enzyme